MVVLPPQWNHETFLPPRFNNYLVVRMAQIVSLVLENRD